MDSRNKMSTRLHAIIVKTLNRAGAFFFLLCSNKACGFILPISTTFPPLGKSIPSSTRHQFSTQNQLTLPSLPISRFTPSSPPAESTKSIDPSPALSKPLPPKKIKSPDQPTPRSTSGKKSPASTHARTHSAPHRLSPLRIPTTSSALISSHLLSDHSHPRRTTRRDRPTCCSLWHAAHFVSLRKIDDVVMGGDDRQRQRQRERKEGSDGGRASEGSEGRERAREESARDEDWQQISEAHVLSSKRGFASSSRR